jgi:hypothetical protein
MQDIGNKLKNVLVNNNIGKICQNYLPLQHPLFRQLLQNPCSKFHSEQKPKPKLTTLRVDLSGKLDSKGKLTQQEQQCRIDKNLCLFCGGSGHQTDTCPVKSTRGRAATMESVPTPSK